MIPSIEWTKDNKVKMIDQLLLPFELKFLEITDFRKVASAIKDMNVRGAPVIGVAAAMGVALATIEYKKLSKKEFLKKVKEAADLIRSTRPTASNLFWAIDRIWKIVESAIDDPPEISDLVVEEVQIMAQEDINRNKSIGKHGAALLKDGDTVLTHCNAGSLATVQYGTALAPIRTAIEQGKRISVIADETRPKLQGATLTAYELHYDKIPVKVISDTSSGLIMRLKKVNLAIVGADRITSDAVFNKIGTYLVALAAKDNNIPFYVAAPTSTLSLHETSDKVKIEERDTKEVSYVLGKLRIIPEGVECINYAFDITPFRLISGIITEDGVYNPPELLKKYLNK